MPVAGKWAGVATIYDGVKDKTVPYRGGHVVIAGTMVTIRPALTTGDWLVGAHLKGIVVPGVGHTPPPNWPELAWKALNPVSVAKAR